MQSLKESHLRASNQLGASNLLLKVPFLHTRRAMYESNVYECNKNGVKTFGQEITDLDTKSEEKKKAYIEGLVKQIDVQWNESEREHELTLTFNLPIVNDGITWREIENYEGHGRRARRYDIYEGSTKTILKAKKKDGRG